MRIPTCLFLLALMAAALYGAEESAGGDGTAWTPEILAGEASKLHYLPDFSYAGYRCGEQPLPEHKPTLNVTDFGATPDDESDDTAAILKALAAAHQAEGPAVLAFPKGRFIVKEILYLERSHLVVQGAGCGKDGTVLFFPTHLGAMNLPASIEKTIAYNKANNKTVGGKLFSPFSWTGGVIWTRCGEKGTDLPPLKIKAGQRGQHRVSVEAPGALKPGMSVRIDWYNREGKSSSFLKHLFGAKVSYGERLYEDAGKPLVSQVVTVASIDESTIVLKEPLLHDLKPEWSPELVAHADIVEVGIEKLRIEFPNVKYAGHHLEAGYNGLFLTGLGHSWVREVTIVNADNGCMLSGSHHVTLKDFEIAGRGGHHAIGMGGNHNLAIDFKITAPSLHNPGFNTKSCACVYSNGEVHHARFDQHCGANHQNLFDHIRAVGGATLAHGGAGYWKPTHGAFNTFWNIRIDAGAAGKSLNLGAITDGPLARLVGVHGRGTIQVKYGPEAYLEGLNRPNLAVPSLYRYQLEKRLKGTEPRP